MIESLLALVGLAFSLVFAFPAAVLLLPWPRLPVVLGLTTLALSAGGLTLWMFALAWLAPGLFNLQVILAGPLAGYAVGFWWLLRTGRFMPAEAGGAAKLARAARRQPALAAAAVLAVVMGALILFNAVYWPFEAEDAMAIYGGLGRHIYYYGELPTERGVHDAYPMLVPLSYTYTHMLTGRVDEYVARLTPAILSVAVMGAAYALGRAMFGAPVGIAAAALLALTPNYTRWASAGYADLPAAFFFTMTALFLWRHASNGRAGDAILAGIMAGLAAWTKNSALLLAGSLPLWIVYTHVRPRLWGKSSTRPVTWNHAQIMLGAMALVAGWWYLRTLALFDVIIPPTGWTWAAQRTPRNLLPFVTYPKDYLAPGVIFTAGIALSLWRAVRGERRDALMLALGGPLFAAWWLLFSYEVRFLLLILPLAAVMGARALVEAAGWAAARARQRAARSAVKRLWRPLSWFKLPGQIRQARRAGRAAAALGIAALVALALPAAAKAVMFKDEIIRDPLMSDVARHRLNTGPAYEVAAYLDALAPETPVMSTVRYVDYYAGPEVTVLNGWVRRDEAGVWVLDASEEHEAPADAELLTEIGGAQVYRVARPEG